MTVLDQMISTALIDSVDLTTAEMTSAVTLRPFGQGAGTDAKVSRPKPTKETQADGTDPSAGGGSGEGDDDDRRNVFEWLGDQVEQGAEWIEDVAEEIAETVGQVVGEGLDAVNDAFGAVGDAASDLAEDVFEVVEDVWNSTIGPVVDEVLEGLEDIGVFDLVDTITLGVVDISYDGGDLHVDLGIDGVGSIGLDIGEDGIFVEGDYLGNGANLGWGSDGSLQVGASVGLGPLAGAGIDLGVEGDGDVSMGADGEIHIPVPTGGTIDLEAEGSWTQDGDSYTIAGEYTGGYTTAGGQYAGSGSHFSTTDDGEDNSVTEIGKHQVVGQQGVAEVRTEENVTIYSSDGEITGTKGEVSLSVDTVATEEREWTSVIWDTQHDDKDEDDDKGGKGGGKRGGNGGADERTVARDDLDDDLLAPRHRAGAAVAAAGLAGTAELADGVDLDGEDTGGVQAQAGGLRESIGEMFDDTMSKVGEELKEHVQPKINDMIDSGMDSLFGEDGTDGNGNSEEGGSTDSGGGESSGGDSGGGDSGGGDSGGTTTERRMHQPERAQFDDDLLATRTRTAVVSVGIEELTFASASADGGAGSGPGTAEPPVDEPPVDQDPIEPIEPTEPIEPIESQPLEPAHALMSVEPVEPIENDETHFESAPINDLGIELEGDTL